MKVKQRKNSKRFRAPTRSSPTKKSEVAGSLPEVASVDSKVANRVIRMPNSQLIKTSMVSDLTRMHAASSSNASNNNVINNSDKANIKEKQLTEMLVAMNILSFTVEMDKIKTLTEIFSDKQRSIFEGVADSREDSMVKIHSQIFREKWSKCINSNEPSNKHTKSSIENGSDSRNIKSIRVKISLTRNSERDIRWTITMSRNEEKVKKILLIPRLRIGTMHSVWILIAP